MLYFLSSLTPIYKVSGESNFPNPLSLSLLFLLHSTALFLSPLRHSFSLSAAAADPAVQNCLM